MLWHQFNRQINVVNCDRVYFVDWTNSCDNESEDELWTLLSCVAFSWMCILHIIERPFLLSSWWILALAKKEKDKRQIDGGVSALFLSFPHLSCSYFMCKNKCAHKTFQFYVWRNTTASFLYSSENIPFDSCKVAQMKHMHVNEHFRIILKLTKTEAFVFLSPTNET